MSAEKEDIKRLSLLLFMVAVLAFFAVLSVSQGAAFRLFTETDSRRRIRLFAIFGYLVQLRACL